MQAAEVGIREDSSTDCERTVPPGPDDRRYERGEEQGYTRQRLKVLIRESQLMRRTTCLLLRAQVCGESLVMRADPAVDNGSSSFART